MDLYVKEILVIKMYGAVCSATPTFAGVNSADACPAYNLKVTRAGSVRVPPSDL